VHAVSREKLVHANQPPARRSRWWRPALRWFSSSRPVGASVPATVTARGSTHCRWARCTQRPPHAWLPERRARWIRSLKIARLVVGEFEARPREVAISTELCVAESHSTTSARACDRARCPACWP